ncbi:hypothetical protein WDZ92_36385 [Nostoc sp. NIES-2111]
MSATQISSLGLIWRRPSLPHVAVRWCSNRQEARKVLGWCSTQVDLTGDFYGFVETIASGDPLNVDGTTFDMRHWLHAPAKRYRVTVRFSDLSAAEAFQRRFR